ncbi:ribonuclease M5 [Aerococcus sanguinicola]|uniref:Ribonuclease M5 n=1 Tax=Aerococcus sanguinicola TaxID=119206 RepID=A0A0X8FAI6_9LACT|nr:MULTISPECIES: ribonuclease M5 [Aerococcus]AMB93747.1 ribonuclease M5 [Aerococcus sanguinicola]MDK7050404.1 ribonuclease M5 [Aerococcus sanguinicola]OFT94787.1 ribonuclease M5 [Aerococcus sp. HMSC23C02]PKZ21524.1 ribonuclease M5 [Aerococcus sanguinicola]
MAKDKIKEVIVVEGRDDTRRLQEIFDVYTIETGGSALNETILDQIRQAQAVKGVIVFTDPDISGTKIRQAIQTAVPGVQHAFISREDARSSSLRASLGVEHASEAAIRQALDRVYTVVDQDAGVQAVDRSALLDLGLLGGKDAQQRRDYLAEQLYIGHSNGKQLAKRLQMFQIPIERVKEVMADYEADQAEEDL